MIHAIGIGKSIDGVKLATVHSALWIFPAALSDARQLNEVYPGEHPETIPCVGIDLYGE